MNRTLDGGTEGLRLSLRICSDVSGVACCAAERLCALCAEAVERDGVFTLALSGGSTPLELFRLLRTEIWRERFDWRHTRVFWVDERCVDHNHAASNFGAANRELLAHVPAAGVFPMHGEGDPEESAVAYEATLRRWIPAGADGLPHLDCALLGMGEDGHTASLFPGSSLLEDWALRSGRLTDACTATHLSGPESRRLTLTLPMLNASKTCLFLATGAGKRAVLRQALDLLAPPLLPVQRVRPLRGELAWVVDAQACAV